MDKKKYVYYSIKNMGDDESNCIINAVLVGIVISVVMPRVLLMFAEPGEVKQPLQLDGLSDKSKLMHLMAHKEKMPILSALIVAFIVGLSVYLGYILKPMDLLKSE